MVQIKKRRVIGPIIVPDTPDCDYNDGEELLSYEKIEALRESFKDYNIIDYQHQFTDDRKPYFMQQIGEPVRLFYNDDPVEFEDVTGTMVEVPNKTLWLESDIWNEQVIKEIDDKEIVAYSITVAEKTDADQVMSIYNKLSTKHANKEQIDTIRLQEINDKLSNKRTLIRDIQDPVLLTTSVVKFPCVNKARFCKNTLNEVENMVDDTNNANKEDVNANDTFINSLQSIITKYRNSNKKIDEEKVEETVVTDEKVEKMINEHIGAIKEELKAEKEEIIAAVKALLSDEGKVNGAGYVHEVYDKKGNLVNETEPEVVEDTVDGEATKEDESVEAEPVTDEAEDEPESEPVTAEDESAEAEPAEETEVETATKGRGDKSYKHDIIQFAQPSAQTSRKSAKIDEGAKKMTIKRNEDDIIYDSIKNGVSTKSINMDEVDLTGTGLSSEYTNEVFLALLNNRQATEVYKASFSEANTNKAILTTAVFSNFVSKLIQNEPIFEDANYQTGHHGKGYIYDLGLGTYDTEDGHLPENFYFDKDPADDVFNIDAREVKCYTQRRKVTISDRQRLGNVYGDDLVNKVLEISRKKLFRGVYAARIWGDTTLANTVDIQYRRQNGLIKAAGQQLESTTDFGVTKASEIFDAMFFSLPEEAQVPNDYVFYVPSNVYRAYNAERYSKATDSYYEQISTNIPLTWNDIPVKVSPTLNRADVKTLTYGGDSAVLLTAPDNTNLFVGREAGIELKRNADTSSDTFYETIDTGVAYTIPDYAVVGKIGADDYASLISNE